MTEMEEREPRPAPMTAVEYQIVRMDGTLMLSQVAPACGAFIWEPALGMEIQGACAGRYRVFPDGPWVVRAYYPDGFPGPQGEWPEGAELPGGRPAIA